MEAKSTAAREQYKLQIAKENVIKGEVKVEEMKKSADTIESAAKVTQASYQAKVKDAADLLVKPGLLDEEKAMAAAQLDAYNAQVASTNYMFR